LTKYDRSHGQGFTLSTLEGQSVVDALATSRARVGQLEREAIEREGEAEEDLRAHLARYRSLVLAIAQVIWTHDSGGEMVGEQPSWAAYTGQTLAQYQGRGWLDAVHPDDRAASVEAWARAVSMSVPYEVEHRLRRYDGKYRYFSARAVPVLADDDTIHEWAGIHTDITQRKLVEQTLRDGVRQFQELADSMPQIVWAAGPDGHFDYYNKRWYEFTGRPVGISGDESWSDVVHPEDQRECLERWHAATRSGDPYEIEYRLREKSGTYHWFLRRALPVRDPAGHITRWFGTCTNIDAVKRTEEVLRRANAETDALNRELEAFSYSVAHDLRSPLRAIDGFSQAVLEDSAERLDAEGKVNLARVRAAAQQMGRLIDALLTLAQVGRTELRREQVNLTRVARGVGDRLREANAERDVALVVHEGLVAEGDATLLTAVMENLLGNAWKFTSQRPRAHIEVGRASKDGQPVYFVRDDGAGFDMAHAGKLFGAFQRLHATHEFPGTGIGLATVQRIVRRHGGQIWAEGEVGRGATFFFTLGNQTKQARS
jgi:PAS domain S-box-containing protein